MRIRKRGAIAVVDSLVGVALLAIDAWSRFSQLSTLPWWRYVQPWLPAAYGICFLTGLLLLRANYEAADYEFVTDPNNEYGIEGGSVTEFYRVTVQNYGHAPV